MDNDEFKFCRFCKEKIRKEAVKCRFCGEWLEQEVGSATPPACTASPPAQQLQPAAVQNVEEKVQPVEKQKIALYWISAGLLVVASLVYASIFLRTPWDQLSPTETDKATTNLAMIASRALICAGLIAWAVKRKGYRILSFSAVCVLMTLYSLYHFQKGRESAHQKRKALTSNLASDYNEFVRYSEQGATGAAPTIHKTGDKDIDAFTSILNELVNALAQKAASMDREITELGQQSAFASSLLTNKSNLKLEIPKRIEAQKILTKYKADFVLTIQESRRKYESLDVSKGKRGGLDGLDKSISQYEEMLNLRINAQRAELEFLQFMLDSYEDYRIKDGVISFYNVANSKRYNTLSKNIEDTAVAVDAYVQARVNASRNALEKLNQ